MSHGNTSPVPNAARYAAVLAIVLAFLFAWGCKSKEVPKPAVKAPEKVLGIPVGTLAYTSEGGLWVLRKGGKPEVVHEGAIWFPSVSPDCTRVAFWEDSGATMSLQVINLISRQVTKLGQWESLGSLGRNLNLRNAPCWSAASDRIWFADGSQIWEVAPDGSNLQTVYEHREGGCYSVTTSPDAKSVAFIGVGEKDQNLWVYSTLTHEAKQVTDFPQKDGMVGAPAWSPDTFKVAYVLYKAEDSNIWTVPPAGGQAIALTTGGKTNSPCWDFTGKRLVVGSGMQNPYAWQVALVNFEDGKFLEQMTTAARGASSPSLAGDW